MDDLRGGRFAERELVATLQCAGNRRAELMEVRDIPGEAPWGPAATGTASWRGVALCDVLAEAGVAGGTRHVARVDVSTDGGATWREAELLEDLGRWAWRLWRAEVDLEPGEHEIVVRAWDSAGATQPEDPAAVWNPKGYVNSSWARVGVVASAAGLT